MSLILIRSSEIFNMSNAPAAGLLNESHFMQNQIRRHSTLFNDSSDSEREGGPTNEVVILEPTPVEEFFDVFANKFTDKDAAYRDHKLKSFREDCNIQNCV